MIHHQHQHYHCHPFIPLTCKTSKVIHFVFQSVEFTLSEVGEAGHTLHNEAVGDGSDGVHVHFSGYLVLPARLDVRLDQVLIETVT